MPMASQPTTETLGKSRRRNEDPRLLTGQALFTDDVHLEGLVHAAFLRSPYAHARLRGVRAARSPARRGVLSVYTAPALGDFWGPGPLLFAPPPIERLVFHER